MPKVGKKKFPYTAKGKVAAKAFAKKTKQPLMDKTEAKFPDSKFPPKGKKGAKPNPKAPLGQGGRFAALAKKVGSPALAAFIGRKKFGKSKFQKLATKGE